MSSQNGSTARANGRAAGRSLLKDHAYEELKRRLLRGDYEPGSFLAERQLAADLGMSKTPVKAALERLEYDGFVTISPQQGVVVRELALREIADVYEIRLALETFIVRLLAGKLTPEQTAELKENLAEQQANQKRGDVEVGVELDSRFHLMFAEFLGNQEMLRVSLQLREKMLRVITAVFRINRRRIDSSYEEHRAIAEAVISGDGPEAARLVEHHLAVGKKFLLSTRGDE